MVPGNLLPIGEKRDNKRSLTTDVNAEEDQLTRGGYPVRVVFESFLQGRVRGSAMEKEKRGLMGAFNCPAKKIWGRVELTQDHLTGGKPRNGKEKTVSKSISLPPGRPDGLPKREPKKNSKTDLSQSLTQTFHAQGEDGWDQNWKKLRGSRKSEKGDNSEKSLKKRGRNRNHSTGGRCGEAGYKPVGKVSQTKG